MITGFAESHGTAGDSHNNADGLSFPPWTMAVKLRIGGKKMSWHWKHPHMHVCSASWHCDKRVYVCECVSQCEIMWETVKKEQARTPSEAEYRASPCSPPYALAFLTSSLILPLFIFSRSASLLRQTHFHSSRIHSFPPLSFVWTPKLKSKASSGSSGNSVERWRKAKRNSVDQHLR